MLRVGNGIIVDFQSGEINGYIPNGHKSDVIKNIYLILLIIKNIMYNKTYVLRRML